MPNEITNKQMHYHLLGVTLASNFRFVEQMQRSNGQAAAVSFHCLDVQQFDDRWASVEPAYQSPYRLPSGQPILLGYRHEDGYDVLRFTTYADFYIEPTQIVCHRLAETPLRLVEMWFTGTVLSLWLERRGIPVFHAAAVAVGDNAIGFLANSLAGKSSMAAAMVQKGYPLLSDDPLPLIQCGDQFMAQPSYPQMRMWPEQAEHFLGSWEALELMHPLTSKRLLPIGEKGWGRFCETAKPLAALYLPCRQEPAKGTAISITPLPPQPALLELVRHSFLARHLASMAEQGQRLSVVAAIAQTVPLRRVVYPSGLAYLPTVCECIAADVEKLVHEGRQETRGLAGPLASLLP